MLSLGSMAEIRVELLLVFFTGTMLLGSVQAWELIKDSDLSIFQTGQWSESQSVPSPGKPTRDLERLDEQCVYC